MCIRDRFGAVRAVWHGGVCFGLGFVHRVSFLPLLGRGFACGVLQPLVVALRPKKSAFPSRRGQAFGPGAPAAPQSPAPGMLRRGCGPPGRTTLRLQHSTNNHWLSSTRFAEKFLKKLASFFDFPIAFYLPNRYNEAMGTRGLPARRARPAMRAGFLEVAN